MKFDLIDNLSGFSDIGTIVYYPERPFYLGKDIDPEYLFKKCATYSYLHSTSLISEYVDFGKSGFSFLGGSQEELIPNLFDYQSTLELLGDSDFDSLVASSFPSLSVTPDVGDQGKHFFGKISSPTKTAYLSHLPKGTWKVEVYNSRVTGNCGEDCFIDYDVLRDLGSDLLWDKYGLKILEVPSLIIYFGPPQDVYIQDFTLEELKGGFKLYSDRYVNLTNQHYQSFKEGLSKTEYIKSYREEVQGEKMLYIVNTPDGKIEDINFYSLSYPESKNPHPHMSEVVLRNDCLWSDTPHIIDNPSSGVMIDSRSGVLLGLRRLTTKESSWFNGAISLTTQRVNGKIWEKAGVDDVFGDNPEISPWWYCLEDLPESKFRNFYITSLGKGKVSPSGLVYLGPNKLLRMKIEPSKGYRYSGINNVDEKEHIKKTDTPNEYEIDITNSILYPKGHKFEVILDEIIYSMNLQIDCLRDFPGNEGKKNTYSISEIGNPGGFNFESLPLNKVDLFYLSEFGMEMKFGDTDSIYNKSNLPKVSDTGDLYFRLDFSNSPYEMNGVLKYGDGRNLDTETINGVDWYVLKVSKFPDSIFSSNSESIILIGEILSKKYTVTIKALTGIQISTPKRNIMEYNNMDPKASEPVPRPFITKMILEDNNSVEVWKNGVLIEGNDGSWKFTQGSDGIWTFEIPAIDSNYEIIVK